MAKNSIRENGVGLAAMALMHALLDKLGSESILKDAEVTSVIKSAQIYVDQLYSEELRPEIVAGAGVILEDLEASYNLCEK